MIVLTLIISLSTVCADVVCNVKTVDYDSKENKIHVIVRCSSTTSGYISDYPRDFVILIDSSKSMEELYGYEKNKNGIR